MAEIAAKCSQLQYPTQGPGVEYATVAREWRCKWSLEHNRASVGAIQQIWAATAPQVRQLAGLVQVQRFVCGGCLDFKVVVSLRVDEYEEWSDGGHTPEESFLRELRAVPGVTEVEAQTLSVMDCTTRDTLPPKVCTRPPASAVMYYFCGRGKAEQARWLLAYTGETFSNHTLTRSEEFKALKDEGRLLFGQLPLLEIDGLRLTQSQAMVRYLARKHSLMGNTLNEQARVDMLAEGVNDFVGPPMGFAFAEARGEREKALEGVRLRLEKLAPRFEKMLVATGRKVTVLGGGRITYADVLLAEGLTSYCELGFGDKIAQAYPRCDALRLYVTTCPPLASYLSSSLRHHFPDAAYVQNVNTVLSR